jgi:hypothetical protein
LSISEPTFSPPPSVSSNATARVAGTSNTGHQQGEGSTGSSGLGMGMGALTGLGGYVGLGGKAGVPVGTDVGNGEVLLARDGMSP